MLNARLLLSLTDPPERGTVRASRLPRPLRRGFTLVEVVAVIVVLGVLLGVALPRFMDHRDRARNAVARGTRGALAEAVRLASMDVVTRTGVEVMPASLGGILATDQDEELLNPYRDPAQPIYDIDGAAPVTQWHGFQKTIEDAVAAGRGAIWYNPNNGAVRFRVPEQASNAETIAVYNEVNQCDITSLSQTS